MKNLVTSAFSAITFATVALTGCSAPIAEEEHEAAGEVSLAPDVVWTPNANRLVARRAGGGFTAPMPPGSTCAYGAVKHALDVNARGIVSEICQMDAASGSLRPTEVITYVNPQKLETILSAARKVRAKPRGACGADKPLLTLTVGTPSGETSYTDEFYSCFGPGPFAENIDDVLAAFAAVVQPPTAVVPENTSKLVAESEGGGHTMAPPAGSACLPGAQRFELDPGTGQLAWKICKIVDWSTPFTIERGSRLVTRLERAQIFNAAKAVKISTSSACGADKPMTTLSVTVPDAGTQKYTDSFFSCTGDGPFVDGLDPLLAVFRDVSGTNP